MCALGLVWHTLAKFGRHDLTARCAARVEQVGNPSAGQDPLIRGMLQQMRSLMLQREADLWGSLQAAKASVANYEEAGDRRLAASVRLLVVQQYLDLGAYARAEKELRDLLRVDDDSFMVTTLGRNLLAHALAARGALEEARGLAVGIQDSPLARNNSYSEVHNRIALADILLRSGDFGAAEREARAAAQFLSVLPAGLASSAMTTLTAILAQALLQQERAGEALRVIEDAAAQRQMRGVGDYHEVTLHLTHAEALHATGDHARARAVLLQTRDLLLSRAAKIADPELRRSFLENVSENARVLALAAALQIGAG
jgi:tetratricopeptide (TPR) repeat protein